LSLASLLAGIVKLFAAVAEWFRDKQLIDAGRAAERGAQDAKGLEAIAKANAAAKAVDNSPEAIADDPDNLDRRRP
jgi:hypothetical protein